MVHTSASVCFTSHVYQHTYNIQYTHLSFTTKVSRLFLQAAFISPLKWFLFVFTV